MSLRCGRRRVSHLPLATVTVRAGATLRAGAAIGTVAPGHGGLHVGVRREGDPFAYEDPIPLLTRHSPARPPVRRRPAAQGSSPPARTAPRAAPGAIRSARARRAARRDPSRAAPRHAARRDPSAPHPAARPGCAPARIAPRRARSIRPASHPAASTGRRPAPWPVFAGLALLLAGAAGSGTAVIRRRRRGVALTLSPAESPR